MSRRHIRAHEKEYVLDHAGHPATEEGIDPDEF
jgi:hypothetical protein